MGRGADGGRPVWFFILVLMEGCFTLLPKFLEFIALASLTLDVTQGLQLFALGYIRGIF